MDDRELMEQVLEKELIYDGKVVHLERWQVALPGGQRALREAVSHVGAVAVVACGADGRISMVKQHRVVVGEVMLEIPAGKLDSRDEDPLKAAQRELREETGLTAGTWTQLAAVITTPGFCDERITLYLATDLTEGEAEPDEDEYLSALRYPAEVLYRMVYGGEISDMKTACALLLAKPHLERMGLIPIQTIS